MSLWGSIYRRKYQLDPAHWGMVSVSRIPAITKWLEEKGIGHGQVNYKLRDWVFSRQRYWGEPIPMVYCEKCGWQPLPAISYRNLCQNREYSRCRVVCSMPPLYQSTASPPRTRRASW